MHFVWCVWCSDAVCKWNTFVCFSIIYSILNCYHFDLTSHWRYWYFWLKCKNYSIRYISSHHYIFNKEDTTSPTKKIQFLHGRKIDMSVSISIACSESYCLWVGLNDIKFAWEEYKKVLLCAYVCQKMRYTSNFMLI